MKKIFFCDLEQAGLRNALVQILEAADQSFEFDDLSPESLIRPPKVSKRERAGCSPEGPELVFLLAGANSQEVLTGCLERLRAGRIECPIIGVLSVASPGQMLDLFKAGMSDVLVTPLREMDALARVWRWLDPNKRDDLSVAKLKEKLGLPELVGESAAVMAEIHKIARYAPSNGTVLITGERGTGKGLVANALHRLSRRAAMPFMTLNCGGLHGELLESQLFGHALGAFTGAVSAAPGLFQQANGGTIFLDEMEGMTLPVQIKLLNVLQDKQFRALGSSKLCTVDARIIAATNTNIEEAVKQGRIRADLYDRLNVLRLRMPPLRERIGDVPLLARRFLTRFACDEGKRIDGVTAAAWMKLQAYDWPGNVRDLENVMLRAVLSSQHSNITADDISLATAEVAKSQPYKTRKAANQWAFDEHVVRTALVSSGGNITRAAQAEGMDPRAFRQLVRDHGIPPRAGSGIRFAPNSLEAPPRQSWRHTAGIVP